MTALDAKHAGFTHIGYIYGIVKIYAKNIDQETPDIVEVSRFYGVLLDLLECIYLNVFRADGFYLKLREINHEDLNKTPILTTSTIISLVSIVILFYLLLKNFKVL